MPAEKPDRTEAKLQIEPIENADAKLPSDPKEPIEANDPAEPMDRIDPAEPMDRIDPVEPMDRIEPFAPMDRIELPSPPGPGEPPVRHDRIVAPAPAPAAGAPGVSGAGCERRPGVSGGRV